jgi:hypothetical protein
VHPISVKDLVRYSPLQTIEPLVLQNRQTTRRSTLISKIMTLFALPAGWTGKQVQGLGAAGPGAGGSWA